MKKEETGGGEEEERETFSPEFPKFEFERKRIGGERGGGERSGPEKRLTGFPPSSVGKEGGGRRRPGRLGSKYRETGRSVCEANSG